MIRVIAAFSLGPIATQITQAVKYQAAQSNGKKGLSLVPYSAFGIDAEKLASQSNNVQLLLKLCTLLYKKGVLASILPQGLFVPEIRKN
jgi:hypothetical protein